MAKLLDILLQRSDITIPWGFQIRGGRDMDCQPFISSVTFGTLAAQYLSAGDKILQLERRNAQDLFQSDIEYLLDRDGKSLHLIVQKSPNIAFTESRRISVDRPSSVNSRVSRPNTPYEYKPLIKLGLRDEGARSPFLTMSTDDEDVNIDLHVEYKQTLYEGKRIPDAEFFRGFKKEINNPISNQKRMQVLSENFMKTVFPEKERMYSEFNNIPHAKEQTDRKPQTNAAGDVPQPPPPPSFPGSLPGHRLKTEIPEKCHEPPAAIQNAMMTKDKKPFTYTPGGLDLSEIKSPRMQRRINRNACADEIPGEPAPTTGNQLSPSNASSPSAYYQPPPSNLPTRGIPPPPPPPPPGSASPNPPPPPPPSAVPSSVPKPSVSPHRPPQGGFDPNEILARVNRNQNQNQNQIAEPKQDNYQTNSYYNEPVQTYSSPIQERTQPEYRFESKPAQNEHSSGNMTRINEPGHIYVPQIAPKLQNEPGSIYVPTVPNTSHSSPRGQLGSIYIPPVTNMTEETNTPPSASSYGYQVQSPPSTASPTSPLSQIELSKAPTPWLNRSNNQSTVPSWASREPETPKASNTRIIPIQIEGRDPPVTVNQKSLQQQYQTQPQYQQQQQQQQQQYQYQHQQPQQYQYQQQPSPPPPPPPRQQPTSNARVIPIQIEGANRAVNNQDARNTGPAYNQNKFNPMTPSSPTPYSPTCETIVDQKPQWAHVQPRPFKVIQKNAEDPQEQRSQLKGNQTQGRPPQQSYQPPQPEYGTYNTAGVPLSQLRKMQLSEDDRALMDKFKQQVDDENYLHRESDPRYRGAAIPSRAFRMLQCMTDTAGDVPPQVSRVPARTPVNRQQSDGQFQQEGPPGPYIPPSEQQVQEPRKYTGGSIPSRSFRMLQAMTGQEGTGSNVSDL